jgi:myo-inositol-1(or 4)-monophosphatase
MPGTSRPGLLLVREAGGLIGAIGPDEDPLVTGDVIAANAEVFKTFAGIIRDT